jgi:hypothetical protein
MAGFKRIEVNNMKLKVIRGSVKYDDVVYVEGQVFEIGEQGKSLLTTGIVELAGKEQEVEKKVEVKKTKKVEAKPSKEEVNEDISVEPSLDWTRKELNEVASNLGIEEPKKFKSKNSILMAIKGVKQK